MAPEEIYPNLFCIKIPLPESPLKYLNAYLIKGDKRNLLVDTGLNREECKTAMMEGLQDIGVDLESLDIFITHLHADHFGLVAKLAKAGSRIYFNRPDAELVENWQGFEPMIVYAAKNGFPEQMLRDALNQHPGFKYGSKWVPFLSMINDNDVLEVGDYRFTAIQTPGHTRGHTCLYEAEKRFFIAGDHLLEDITPNIQCWEEDNDPLRSYMESLDKVRPLEVDRVLPGHRRLFTNFRRRIDELKSHHENRLDEVMEILAAESPKTAYETAAQMTWDITAKSWEDFPVAQKWFATGEAISHLRYLENQKKIRRAENEPVILFELVQQD